MKRIFVIEDNDSNYLLLEGILSAFDVELVRAETGSEFYSIIKTHPVNFDLILMDIMLPDTDGITLTKYLINEKFRIPIIFISAYTDKCEEIYDLGIEFFISKPIVSQLLISVIRKYIELKEV